MGESLAPEIIRAVFAAAAASTDWRQTDLGLQIEVRHDDYRYTVEIDRTGRFLAEIVYRSGYGRVVDVARATATPAEHVLMVDAAYASLAEGHRSR